MVKTVADQFAHALAPFGVKRIFGVVGDTLKGLTDSLRRQGKIEWIHPWQEEVICLSGDRGFAMLMGDFLGLAQLRLPVEIIVLNNGSFGFIELEQKSTGFLPNGTELQNSNFADIAEAVGVQGIRVGDPADVDAGVVAALAHDGPVLVDAVARQTELAMPPAVTVEMTDGFALYMTGAVTSGQGNELLDLAKINLWRLV